MQEIKKAYAILCGAAAVGAGRFAGVAGKCTRSLDFREYFIKSRTAYLR